MEAAEPIDLVLTDIIMPGGMNGIDYAEEIERRWPDLPVLLCSGYANQRFTPGRDRPLLRKPYTQASLAQAVAAALDGAARRPAARSA
jgi:CheY-like chemotaxis protein